MAKTPKMNITLRGVIYPEDGMWLAHCLELDIVAEGKSPKAALHDVIDLCELQVKVALQEGNIESVFRPAPPEIWKLFCMAEETASTNITRHPKRSKKGLTALKRGSSSLPNGRKINPLQSPPKDS